MKRALYFGCGPSEKGHYLHEGKRILWDPPPECPWTLELMDGRLLKNGKHQDVYDGRVWWTCGGRGDRNFWYAFFWWDNSMDRRGASNAGFYVLGFQPEIITPETARENAKPAFEYACEQYPWVIARQRQPLSLQP